MCVHPYIKEIDGVLTPLPCGHCIECYKTYQRDWNFRLEQELKQSPCWFITLTYNDWNLPVMSFNGEYQSCVFPSEVQRFMKRYRKLTKYHPCRYFAVGEYGGNYNRAHYHILLFTDLYQNVSQCYNDIIKAWTLDGTLQGFVYCKFALKEHFHYLTKYVNKLDKRPHLMKPFKLMSKSLGLSFLSDSMLEYFNTTFSRTVVHDGHTVPLPRYYVKKLNDERFNWSLNYYGVKWSDFAYYKHRPNPHQDSPRWFHDYFCHNYDEIRDVFIEHELDNSYIVKFLDPSINIVFDWYLSSCKTCADIFAHADYQLGKVMIKENSQSRGQPIGRDDLLRYDILNDFG